MAQIPLVSSNFSSMRAFQDYFQQQEELPLPANQRCFIRGVAPLVDGYRFLGNKKKFESLLEEINWVLDNILYPIGKRAELLFLEEGTIGCSSGEDFSFRYSLAMRIKVEPARVIDTRLGDLFNVMVATSRLDFSLVPEQCLLTPLEGGKKNSLMDSFQETLHFDRPFGFGFKVSSSGPIDLSCCVSSEGQFLQIKSKEGISISLTPKFSFTLTAFAERMHLYPKMVIPANQALCIQDENFSRLIREGEYLGEGLDILDIFKNRILLPFAKVLQINFAERQEVIYSFQEDCLKLSSTEEFSLEATPGHLHIDVKMLGDSFRTHKLSALYIEPGQKVFIYGIQDVEKEEIIRWMGSISEEEQHRGLTNLLNNRNPIGSIWNLEALDRVTKVLKISSKGSHILEFFSSALMKLELQSVSGDGLILSLINNSHAELLQGILDADEKTMEFLVFKAIFYFCCGDFHSEEDLPKFFKEETLTSIVEIWTVERDSSPVIEEEDSKEAPPSKAKIFKKALGEVIKNQELYDQINAIFNLTPEDFSELNFQTFPPSLNTVMKRLKELTVIELRGSVFLTKCLQVVHQNISEGGNLSQMTQLKQKEAEDLPPPLISITPPPEAEPKRASG